VTSPATDIRFIYDEVLLILSLADAGRGNRARIEKNMEDGSYNA
jgi:hypothetical protein